MGYIFFSSKNDDIKNGHWVQGLVNTWDPSRIHLLETHLIPYKVGQAPCKELSDRRPLGSKLYQKAMEPLLGNVARPWIGKAVAPPSKSER